MARVREAKKTLECQGCGNKLLVTDMKEHPPAGKVVITVAEGHSLFAGSPPICEACRGILRGAIERGEMTKDAELKFVRG